MKKNQAARLIAEGRHDGSVWAEFELPKELVSFRSKSRKAKPGREEQPGSAERLQVTVRAAA